MKREKFTDIWVCPYCGAEEIDSEMIGDAEHNDWWLCTKCDGTFGSHIPKEQYNLLKSK